MCLCGFSTFGYIFSKEVTNLIICFNILTEHAVNFTSEWWPLFNVFLHRRCCCIWSTHSYCGNQGQWWCKWDVLTGIYRETCWRRTDKQFLVWNINNNLSCFRFLFTQTLLSSVSVFLNHILFCLFTIASCVQGAILETLQSSGSYLLMTRWLLWMKTRSLPIHLASSLSQWAKRPSPSPWRLSLINFQSSMSSSFLNWLIFQVSSRSWTMCVISLFSSEVYSSLSCCL